MPGSVYLYDKDLFHLECEWKRAALWVRTKPSTKTLKLLHPKFSNSSRMYFYWRVDREAIIYTLTSDFSARLISKMTAMFS